MTQADQETRVSSRRTARPAVSKSTRSEVPLSALDNDPRIKEVWAVYKQSPSPEMRNDLMEHYLPLVNKCAQRLHQKLPAVVQIGWAVALGRRPAFQVELRHAVAPAQELAPERRTLRRLDGEVREPQHSLVGAP